MTFADWLAFLNTQGANIDTAAQPPAANGFPPTTQLQSDFDAVTAPLQIVPLVHQQLLSIAGADSHTFLQGQLTCDMTQLSNQRSLLGSCCTPKGSVISAFRLLQSGDEQLYLRVDNTLAEATRNHLGKYIIFSKAEINQTTYVGIGLLGAGAAELIHSYWQLQFTQHNEVQHQGEVMVAKVPGVERFEIWCPLSQAEAIWQHLAGTATARGTSTWTLAEIQAGLVQLNDSNSEEYLPQMLNLQAVGAVSFNKGCYTGQEVVTRLQHRGKLKKLLYRGTTNSAAHPRPGMALHTPDRPNAGTVLAVAPSATGYEIQAVISKQTADGQPLHLDTPEGPLVELLPLPYNIDPQLLER